MWLTYVFWGIVFALATIAQGIELSKAVLSWIRSLICKNNEKWWYIYSLPSYRIMEGSCEGVKELYYIQWTGPLTNTPFSWLLQIINVSVVLDTINGGVKT